MDVDYSVEYAVDYGSCMLLLLFVHIMVDHQKRVQLLRQQLDDSIRLYYCQQHATVNRNSNSNSGGGRTVTWGDGKMNRRILHLLFQDETYACVQIMGNTTTKSSSAVVMTKLSNNNCDTVEKLDLVVKSTASPLQVIVNCATQQHHTTPEATINFIATGFNSPIGSIDSGMSSLSSSNNSPASSPGCSPISINCPPFQYIVEQQMISRGRSTSEGESVTIGLKSILKKSIPTYITGTGGRSLRSYSECQSGESGEMKVIIAEMNSAGCTPRKKHVSFSERLVQERSFRPNSSILGQKKRSQRKQKNKLKKKGILALEDSSTDVEVRHRLNCERVDSMCSANCNDYEDEMDPIECDLAACVLNDPLLVTDQVKQADCHMTAEIHKHIIRINSD
ncbi:unnamed protein product [Litomosoides sigmodontis]|uniref:Uncharacterized protein n=1 Tax=Litomosoides sigmodontis TaxID=42156 RepID=A0A3P6TLK7_LITSI|nr:unnamed protein product [Litomosoides sigmodontis]